jgi:hypothetical protein
MKGITPDSIPCTQKFDAAAGIAVFETFAGVRYSIFCRLMLGTQLFLRVSLWFGVEHVAICASGVCEKTTLFSFGVRYCLLFHDLKKHLR